MTPAHRGLTERVAAVLEKQWPGGATPDDIAAVLSAFAPELAVVEAAKELRAKAYAGEPMGDSFDRIFEAVAALGSEGEPK